MNCKPGDLAIVVRSASGLAVGKIVRCIRLTSLGGLRNPYTEQFVWGPVWETDDYGPTKSGQIHPYWGDWSLRPIGNPGEHEVDEMIKRIGKPEAREVTA